MIDEAGKISIFSSGNVHVYQSYLSIYVQILICCRTNGNQIGCVFGAQCAFETLINRIQLNVTTKISQANGCGCVSERRGRMM